MNTVPLPGSISYIRRWVIAAHSYGVMIAPELTCWVVVDRMGKAVFSTSDRETAIYVKDWLVLILYYELRDKGIHQWTF